MSCNTNQQTSTIQNQIPSRGPQYLPGPELDSLRGALALRHHDVLEEDGLVAVSPGDAGVVTRREGRLGVLEMVGGDEGAACGHPAPFPAMPHTCARVRRSASIMIACSTNTRLR